MKVFQNSSKWFIISLIVKSISSFVNSLQELISTFECQKKKLKKTIKKILKFILLTIIILTFYKVQKRGATCLLQLKFQLMSF